MLRDLFFDASQYIIYGHYISFQNKKFLHVQIMWFCQAVFIKTLRWSHFVIEYLKAIHISFGHIHFQIIFCPLLFSFSFCLSLSIVSYCLFLTFNSPSPSLSICLSVSVSFEVCLVCLSVFFCNLYCHSLCLCSSLFNVCLCFSLSISFSPCVQLSQSMPHFWF